MAHTPFIGRIWLEGPDGRVTSTCNYDVPVVLRDTVLHINGGTYRAARQSAHGTWIYRYDGRAPYAATDPHLIEFRNDQHPLWDGPVPPPPPATLDTLHRHFEQLRHADVPRDQFEALFQHFLAVKHGDPCPTL